VQYGREVQLIASLVIARFVRVSGSTLCVFAISLILAIPLAIQSAMAADGHGLAGNASSSKSQLISQDPLCNDTDAAVDSSSVRRQLKRSCLISLSGVDELRPLNGFSLIDVRSDSEFSSFRIAGSINIPLHQIKTKEFLKKLPVVLVSEGRNTSQLEMACKELELSGFRNIAVLDGGLFAWYSDNRVLEGDVAEQANLNRMTAAELFEMRSSPSLTVIDISASGESKELKSWLPAKVIKISANSKSKSKYLARISSEILKLRKKSPQKKLLLISDDDVVYQQVDNKLRNAKVSSGVLRLARGMNGYREHVEKQRLIWSRKEQEAQPRRYEACRG